MVARDPERAKPDQRLSRIANTQLGLFTRRQALSAGVTPQMIKTRLSAGSYMPVHRGVYRFSAAPVSWRQTVLAVVLWGGDEAVASHGTAAKMWRFHVSPTSIEITVPARRVAPNGNIKLHRGTVAGSQFLDGIPVTSPTRTLLDIANRVPAKALEAMVDDAVARRLATPATLEWELSMSGGAGRYGSKAFRNAIAHLRDGYCESPLENKVMWTLLKAGFPPPIRQYRIKVNDAVYRVDFAYAEAKVAIEVDSYQYHSSRERFDADRHRDAALQAIGWRVVRITARGLREPAHFIAAVASARGDRLF